MQHRETQKRSVRFGDDDEHVEDNDDDDGDDDDDDDDWRSCSPRLGVPFAIDLHTT